VPYFTDNVLEQWGLYELTLKSARTHDYPFRGMEVGAEFVHAGSGQKLRVSGFYDGDGVEGQTGRVWKIRFMQVSVLNGP
jgi:Domain of unknown function (DUF5060)